MEREGKGAPHSKERLAHGSTLAYSLRKEDVLLSYFWQSYWREARVMKWGTTVAMPDALVSYPVPHYNVYTVAVPFQSANFQL